MPNNNQHKLEDARKAHTLDGNGTFLDIIKQVLLIATVLFTVSAAVLINPEYLKNLREDSLVTIFIVWILLVISMLAGIFQLNTEYNFHKKWVMKYSKVIEPLSEGTLDDSELKSLWENEGLNGITESSSLPLLIQFAGLIDAILLFLVFIYKVIF